MAQSSSSLQKNRSQFVIVTEEQKPVCQTCHRSVSAKGNNMSNLMTYLKEHHLELYTEAMSLQKSFQGWNRWHEEEGDSKASRSFWYTKTANNN